MDVSNLPSLPVAVGASAAAIAAAVSGLLLLFAVPLANIPGLRPTDETRNAGMRVLLFLLNLLGLVGFAFTQNVVIDRSEVPALLLTAAVAAGAGHIAYVSVKAVRSKRAAPPTFSAQVITPADVGTALASALTDARITPLAPPSSSPAPVGVFGVAESTQSAL